VLGIIGRNGAGKSTLLKILSRITVPTEGTVDLYGRVGSLLEVGTGFHPELTGRENIYLNGAILGMRRVEIERRFDEIVDFAEIERFLDTPVKHYSSGMYVRLAFAVAAHLEPEILLVDEVLAVGDASFQKKCLGKMGEVAGEGRTVLFVSHNMAAVQALCSRVLLFHEGDLVLSGSPGETIPSYLDFGNVQVPQISTAKHPGRRPDMIPVITGVGIKNSDGQSSTSFDIGDQIVLEVTLDPDGNEYHSPGVSIAVFDGIGQLICKLATWTKPEGPEPIKTPVISRWEWYNCRLAPGSYYLNVGFGNGRETIDYIERVGRIEIRPLTESQDGRVPSGVIVPDVGWQVLDL
jgi:lipopolysaccharide transport system ATP-binding protein